MNLYLLTYLAIGTLIGASLAAAGKHYRNFRFLPHSIKDSAFGGAIAAVGLFMVVGVTSTPAYALGVSTANVKAITQEQFQAEVIKSTTPVIVDFYATWCMPCRMMAPNVDKVAEQLSGKVKFLKIDVDNAQDLAQTYHIEGIPALVMFKDGKVIKSMVGLQSEASLKEQISAALNP